MLTKLEGVVCYAEQKMAAADKHPAAASLKLEAQQAYTHITYAVVRRI